MSFAETGSICQWVFGGLVRKNVLIFLDTIIPPNVSNKSGCNVSKSVASKGVINWSILGKKSGWCRFEVVSVSTIQKDLLLIISNIFLEHYCGGFTPTKIIFRFEEFHFL